MERFHLLDSLRGFVLLNMLCYHTIYDKVYIFGADFPRFEGPWGYCWQQFILGGFVLVSGAVASFHLHGRRQGIKLFLLGLLITAFTCFFMPGERIICGVLSFLGMAAFLTAVLRRRLEAVAPWCGVAVSLLAFLLTRNIPFGTFGAYRLRFGEVPASWWNIDWAFFLGLPNNQIYSADYVPLIPWIFFFWLGFYLWRALPALRDFPACRSLELPGRHSLLIYLLHQPVIYLCLKYFNL